jgi:hypothetical protein
MKETAVEPKSSSMEHAPLRKVTITVPQDIYERLIRESARRKIAGAPNRLLSALFREALTEYLDRHSTD